MQEFVIRELPNDAGSIRTIISKLSVEEIQEIKNRCLDDLVVYTGSLKDYDKLRELLPEKNVMILEVCDMELEEREYEYTEHNNQGRGRI